MQSHYNVSKHPSYDPLLEGCTAVREPMQVLFAGPLHCILLPNGMYVCTQGIYEWDVLYVCKGYMNGMCCMYVRDI